ncbi:hypothetical protein KSS87_003894 [Heliosperma pusillum]|nr:hypothetical protein KSS87_003894 [Heliosperma pusillum]
MINKTLSKTHITLTLWLLITSLTMSSSLNTVSIYDALASHGLPIGLLPKGVKAFTLQEDGRFEAHLDQVCRSKLDNQFEYKKDISGRLTYGRVGNLTGMESLELFVWVSVNGIRVDIPNSGRIHFDLEKGVHKELSVSLFETPADCVAVSNPPSLELDRLLTIKGVDRVIEYRRLGHKTSRKDVM